MERGYIPSAISTELYSSHIFCAILIVIEVVGSMICRPLFSVRIQTIGFTPLFPDGLYLTTQNCGFSIGIWFLLCIIRITGNSRIVTPSDPVRHALDAVGEA